MRATDRWAIEERGIPSLELMERAGRGPRRGSSASVAPTGPVAVVCGKGNNGGDGLVAARLLRDGRARGPRAAASRAAGELQGDAARERSSALPGEPPSRSRPSALERRRGRSSTRCSAPASTGAPRGAGRARRSTAIDAARRAGRRGRRAQRRRRLDRRGRAARRCARPRPRRSRRQARAVDQPGQGARRRGRGRRHRHPGGRARSSRAVGLIGAARCWRSSRAATPARRSSRAATCSSRAARAG